MPPRGSSSETSSSTVRRRITFVAWLMTILSVPAVEMVGSVMAVTSEDVEPARLADNERAGEKNEQQQVREREGRARADGRGVEGGRGGGAWQPGRERGDGRLGKKDAGHEARCVRYGHDGPGYDGVQAQRNQVDEKDEQHGAGHGERHGLSECEGDVFEGVTGARKAHRRRDRWREGAVRPGKKYELAGSYQRPAGPRVCQLGTVPN